MAFKPGQSGNPVGMLPMGDDLKKARKLNRNEFELILHKYLFMTFEQIEKLAQSKMLPMIDYMVVSIINKAVSEGDEKRLNFLLDRSIGQVVRKIRIETQVETTGATAPVEMSQAEKLEMLDRMRAKVLQNQPMIDVTPKDPDEE